MKKTLLALIILLVAATYDASACNITPNIYAGGPTTFCNGGNVSLSTDIYVSYLWSTGETTQNITVTTAGNYTVYVTDINGCTGTSAVTVVTVNFSVPPPPGVITGPLNVCQGSTQTYSIPSDSSATNYIWSIPNSWSGVSTTTSITVVIGSTGGFVTVDAANECGSNSTTSTFNYTGAAQTWTVPSGVTSIVVDAAGGSGGNGSTGNGGLGGRIQTSVNVTPSEVLSIYVAGAGGTNNDSAGFNGGGSNDSLNYNSYIGGGGGASDIRQGGTTLLNRIVVAGGGGGGGYNGCTETGGAGGGLTGGAGAIGCATAPAFGGSQIAGGAGGYYSTVFGGDGTLGTGGGGAPNTGGAGGGGGYYGGGGGAWQGGGGGSSYSNGTNSEHTQGYQAGNGYVNISFPSALFVSVMQVPSQAGNIIGPDSVCQGAVVTYYVIPDSTASSYTWTLPSSWTGTSTTNSITVTVGTISGTITVTANNMCGSSVASLLLVIVNHSPSQTLVVGPNPVCSGSVVTYQDNALNNSVATYAWTLPIGWTGSSTTNSITVTVGSSGGPITAIAANQCGASNGAVFNYTSFTQTWTVPSGVNTATFYTFGGGGAGGGSSVTYSLFDNGGGGGGGASSQSTVSVAAGDVYSITVGAGGVGSLANGTNGGATIITGAAGTFSADGGIGGMSGDFNGTGSGSGGTGGTTGTGTIYSGGNGSSGNGNNGITGTGGGGAGSGGAGTSPDSVCGVIASGGIGTYSGGSGGYNAYCGISYSNNGTDGSSPSGGGSGNEGWIGGYAGGNGANGMAVVQSSPTSINIVVVANVYVTFNLFADTSIQHHYFITDSISGVPPYQYLWSWGDGNTDTIAYPSHTYLDSGFYTICLSVTDSTGCQGTFCDSSYHIMRNTNQMVYVNVIPSILTSTHTTDVHNVISVYPNPATNTLTIYQSTPAPNQQLIITNILGEEIYHQPITNTQSTIDISGWSKGVYIYQLTDSNETVRGKFVKE